MAVIPAVLAAAIIGIGWLCWEIGKERGRAEERCRPPLITRADRRTVEPRRQRTIYDYEEGE